MQIEELQLKQLRHQQSGSHGLGIPQDALWQEMLHPANAAATAEASMRAAVTSRCSRASSSNLGFKPSCMLEVECGPAPVQLHSTCCS